VRWRLSGLIQLNFKDVIGKVGKEEDISLAHLGRLVSSMNHRPDATFTRLRTRSDSYDTWLARRILWLALAVLCMLSVTDPDLWGHLRFGLDILRNHSVNALESYSYTSDLPLTNHEWLDEAVMALLYRLGGAPALIILKASVVGGAYFLIIRSYRTARSPLAEVTALVVAIVSLPLTVTIRPQMWSFLFIAVLCQTNLSSASWFALPALFVLWANLHGGWSVGIALLAVRCAGEMWRQRRLDVALMTTLLLSAAGTLINPYGIGLWRFMLSTLRLNRADITEWQPIWGGGSALNIAGWMLGGAIVVAFAKQTYRRRPENLLALVAFALAAQRVQRLVPLFVLSSVLLLAPEITRLAERQPSARPSLHPRGRRLIDSVMLAGIVAVSIYSLSPRLWCIAATAQGVQPDALTASSLHNPELRGRLAVEFDWGEYAIWHFGPRLRVSIDGRRETVYSARVLREQQALAEGSTEGLVILDRDRPEYIWMRRSRAALLRALPSHSYRVDVLTDAAFLAVRSDATHLMRSTRVPAGCFPDF
jgi:hypothetical protein